MAFINVTNTILNEEAKEIEKSYHNYPEIKKALDLFDDECKFRKKLKNLRKEEKVTQKDVSEILGVNQQSISRLENDEETSPSLSKIIAYLSAFGYELDIKPKNQIAK